MRTEVRETRSTASLVNHVDELRRSTVIFSLNFWFCFSSVSAIAGTSASASARSHLQLLSLGLLGTDDRSRRDSTPKDAAFPTICGNCDTTAVVSAVGVKLEYWNDTLERNRITVPALCARYHERGRRPPQGTSLERTMFWAAMLPESRHSPGARVTPFCQ